MPAEEDDDYALDAASAMPAANVEGSGAVARVNAEGSSAVDTDAASLKFSTKPAVPAAAAAAVPTPTEAAAAADAKDDCKDEGDTDADVATAAAAVIAGKAPAKLYRQGSSLILQTHASCQYQFVVSDSARKAPAGNTVWHYLTYA
jgi:hypothetical protein